MNQVELKREKQSIPTYVPRKPIELPMFFEHKPYQGASGRLYPLPFSDSISDEKKDVEYDIFTLENEYIKTQVAPELGGKILRGYDKKRDYDFIYYNEVVKPALVGLAGPWISGGIEFNWPQHHRPTTYMQLEAFAEEGADGSKTVWVGEVEPFNRMKGMAGITVDPGRSYIKAKIKVYNRTEQAQVFMWWANLAVPVNETYKTIFPPDVEWVNDHDRRCIMSWPIAKGVYHTARPFDYGEGTDISMYDAIKVPSSFLVSQGQSDMDFVAGYDGGRQKGIATVADHHISPGKKMWHWGKGDFGDMWCSNLTDENGPYIELMTGVYTDNQPDSYADKATKRLTSRNEHSPNVEALYLKGMALKYLGDSKKAYDVLFKASWDYSYRSAAYFALAQIDCANGEYVEALKKLEVSISLNAGHNKALLLKAAIYRKLGEDDKAKEILAAILENDKLDMGARVEHAVLAASEEVRAVFGSKPENFVDIAADYINAGLYEEALFAMELSADHYPLFQYYAAYCKDALGEETAALKLFEEAEKQDEGYCFPARIDDIRVLEKAIERNPCGAKAYYYLGCLHYDRFNYEKAIALWEKATLKNPTFAKAYRNLALAYFDKKQDYLGAKVCMEKALEYLPGEPRLLMEYQQLLKNMDYSPATRLSVYDKYNELMLLRDDCYLDKLTLKCMVGEYQEAIDMAKHRRFHIYEGGEGKLTKQHAWMHVLYGNALIEAGKYEEAQAIYQAGVDMPKSYGEAKTFFNQEAHIFYYLGKLAEEQGKDGKAYYEEAAVYKAAVSEISLFRALAYRKLMKFREAKEVLDEMIAVADGFIDDCDRRTYYGVGSPSPMPFEDDIVKNNLMNGYTLKAYALLGLGRFNDAEEYMDKARKIIKSDFRVFTYEQIKDRIQSV